MGSSVWLLGLALAVGAGCGGRAKLLDHALRAVSSTRSADDLADIRALRALGLRSQAQAELVARLVSGPPADQAGRLVAALLTAPLPSASGRFDVLCARVARGVEGLQSRGLALLCARHLLRRGQRGAAAALLRRLPGDPRAAHLAALLALAEGRPQVATALLRGAWPRASATLRALLALNLGRLALERGELAQARSYYGRVPRRSPWLRVALAERAWLELRARRPRQVLGLLAVLASPALGGAPAADGELLTALALSELCHPAARRFATQARRHLDAAVKKAAVFLRRRADVRLYYVEATASLAARGAAGTAGLPVELQQALLVDTSFLEVFRLVRQLQRERRILAGPEARILAGVLAARLERRLVTAQTLAGETVRRLLGQTLDELRELRGRAEELLVELDRRAERVGATGPLAAVGRERQGRQQRWPLSGELWLDEIPYYRLRLRSRCRRSSASPGAPASSPLPAASSPLPALSPSAPPTPSPAPRTGRSSR